MKTFSISDIENLTGIKAHSIRIWEQRYNIISPKRTPTNIRYYDDNDLCLFLNISTLIENGYKISKIAEFSSNELCEIVKNLQLDHYNVNVQVQSLSNAMLKMDETEFDEIFENCILTLGVQQTIETIIFPFMRKVGFMWQVGAINIAHEHFATHKIEQRLIAENALLKHKKNVLQKKYLLFLPPSETHQVGLLYTQYLLKLNGHKVLYLGQNLPFESLKQATTYFEPDYALTALTVNNPNWDTLTLIDKILESLGNTKLLIAGALIHNLQLPDKPNLTVINNMFSFKQSIERVCD
ncbi:MAG: MerR family transcriptional regulator [Sphingobacteriales bacterium]|nr:MAG: MerR family transcriptional regulator [Sphingobacteriales bacterium]TAF80918.1 MAG: MerR family transcriptional regulator [Sphingobacteriales bacterium]